MEFIITKTEVRPLETNRPDSDQPKSQNTQAGTGECRYNGRINAIQSVAEYEEYFRIPENRDFRVSDDELGALKPQKRIRPVTSDFVYDPESQNYLSQYEIDRRKHLRELVASIAYSRQIRAITSKSKTF